MDRESEGRELLHAREREKIFRAAGLPRVMPAPSAERSNLRAVDAPSARSQREIILAAREHPSGSGLPLRTRLARLLGVVILAPVCLLSLIAFLKHFLTAALSGSLFHSRDLHWFCFGAVTWGLYHWQWRRGLMVTYVFAHEWTHALVARLFLAKIYRVVWSAQGGYVETNKSNVFISLAPYVMPLYTLVFLAVFTALGSLIDLPAIQELHLGRLTLPFNSQKVFFFGLGLTWFYHLAYTIQTLHTEQSDLQRNGECFSFFVIITLNLYLLAWLLLMCSPDLGWHGAWNTLAETFSGGWELILDAWDYICLMTQATLVEIQQGRR
jgi:hypothetical protein